MPHPASTSNPSPSPTSEAASPRFSEVRPGIAVNTAAWTPLAQKVLTPAALDELGRLHRLLNDEREQLLQRRQANQARIDSGELPDYLAQDSVATSSSWRVNPIPADLRRRRVEITGPVNSPKMVINMLSRNADGIRADAAMVDFEDSLKPSWANLMQGQLNVQGAIRGDLQAEENGKQYAFANPQDLAKLLVRPRGLHLVEANLRIDGKPIAAGLFDAALAFFHGAQWQVEKGQTPAFYIPKTEHYLEARWWNQLFIAMQEGLSLPTGTLKATFLMETLPAAFQMEEILHEIREHAAGLNVGRWDKIFSDIKVLRAHPDRVLADRASITMDRPWMRNYALRCVQISHAHGAYGIGGMSAFTPGREAEVRRQQTAKVIADKTAEYESGHDGCWVSHPYFIEPALGVFKREHQLDVLHSGRDRCPDLLPQGGGPRTLAGLRTNLRVGIGYLHGWQQDIGCVAWDNLMEDLATLEISRAQTWQWLRYGVSLDDGTKVTETLVRQKFQEELERIVEAQPNAELQNQFATAAAEAQRIFTKPDLDDFFTTTSELVR